MMASSSIPAKSPTEGHIRLSSAGDRPVVRNAGTERVMGLVRWGMPPPPKFGGPPVAKILYSIAAVIRERNRWSMHS
jgi:hypothetical protein